jgi:hypothetical protein
MPPALAPACQRGELTINAARAFATIAIYPIDNSFMLIDHATD